MDFSPEKSTMSPPPAKRKKTGATSYDSVTNEEVDDEGLYGSQEEDDATNDVDADADMEETGPPANEDTAGLVSFPTQTNDGLGRHAALRPSLPKYRPESHNHNQDSDNEVEEEERYFSGRERLINERSNRASPTVSNSKTNNEQQPHNTSITAIIRNTKDRLEVIHGTAPFTQAKTSGRKKRLVEHDPINERIKDLRDSGMNFGQIADILNREAMERGEVDYRISQAAVYSRWARNAPIIAQAKGETNWNKESFLTPRNKKRSSWAEPAFKGHRQGDTATSASASPAPGSPTEDMANTVAEALTGDEMKLILELYQNSCLDFWPSVAREFNRLTDRTATNEEIDGDDARAAFESI